MHSYLQRIRDFIKNLDVDSSKAFHDMSHIQHFTKGDFLLKEDDVCRKSYWVIRGIARKYYLHDGKDITTELYFEDDLAISFESYTLQKPSKEYIQALTDISVAVTDYTLFQKMKQQFPKLTELDLMLTEYYAIWLEERLFEFHTLSASERYLNLFEKQPKIVQFVPLTYIASYLGISLETLSRIRAKI
ncbi:Crp/Fnr family transcriptional regulator [bacterium 336/3]|nr:Crp/Fnr family transcriptional regulator [bacterium 336/3]